MNALLLLTHLVGLALGAESAPHVRGSKLPGHRDHFIIAGLGAPILDALDLEALARTAAMEERWEFMLSVAPIPVTGGTGGPINVLATF